MKGNHKLIWRVIQRWASLPNLQVLIWLRNSILYWSDLWCLREQAREFTEQVPVPLSASALRRILQQLKSRTSEMCVRTCRWLRSGTLKWYKTPRDKGIKCQQCFKQSCLQLLPGARLGFLSLMLLVCSWLITARAYGTPKRCQGRQERPFGSFSVSR